jgi:hypothetical protein
MKTVKYRKPTEKQLEAINALHEVGTKTGAARLLGISRAALRDRLAGVDPSKLTPPQLAPVATPGSLGLTKTTVQYNANGEVIQEWRRMSPSQQLAEDVVDRLCEQVEGKAGRIKSVPDTLAHSDIMVEIDIFDPHVGMYAEEKETLDSDYDCDIAVNRMREAVTNLASKSHPYLPGKVVLVFGGDVMHSDTRSNKTEASGNALDVDSRYHRVVNYTVGVIRDCVEIAAKIAPRVDIVFIEGNHDWHSCVWMAEVTKAFYSKSPHINVVSGSSARKHMVFGENLLIWTHGDKIAPAKWPAIIAAEFYKEWGQTQFRHLKMGHIHHKKAIAPVVIDEQAGLVVEYLEALCPL